MPARITQCPRCNSQNMLYRTAGVGFHGQLMVGSGGAFSTGTLKWETYLCPDCGYFENYLTDPDHLSKIKSDPEKAGWHRAS